MSPHDLNTAVLEYLQLQNIDSEILATVASSLGDPPQCALLEKWLVDSKSVVDISKFMPATNPTFIMEGHRNRVSAVAIHPKWSIAASGCADGEIKIWNLETGELERTVLAHTRPVLSLAFSPLSNMLVSSSGDLSVKVWDVGKGMANVRTMRGHEHTVSAVTCAVDSSTNTEYVLSASRDKTIRLWELQTGLFVKSYLGHLDWVRAIAVATVQSSPAQEKHTYLLSVSSDRQAILRPIFETDGSSEEVKTFRNHKNVIECCAIAPREAFKTFEGKEGVEDSENSIIFATGGRDCHIFVYHSDSQTPILDLQGHDNWVQAIQFHPNGKHLISVGDDNNMIIWDLATGKIERKTKIHDHFVTSLAWRNKYVITGSMDQSVRLW